MMGCRRCAGHRHPQAQTLGPGSSVTGTISYTCVSAEFGLCIEGPDIIFGTNTNTVTFESDDPFESSYQVGMTAAVYPF